MANYNRVIFQTRRLEKFLREIIKNFSFPFLISHCSLRVKYSRVVDFKDTISGQNMWRSQPIYFAAPSLRMKTKNRGRRVSRQKVRRKVCERKKPAEAGEKNCRVL